MTPDLTSQDYDDLVLHDVRYCLGRLTWVPGECARRVRRFWPHISRERRAVILYDVREHLRYAERLDPAWGDAENERIWRDLASWCAEHMEDLNE